KRAALREETVGIFQPDIFVILNQIDTVRLKAFQRLIDLARRSLFGTAIEFGHQERLPAIAIAKRLPHADLALAVVVVPAVVEEIHAAVESRANNTDAFLRVLRTADVMAAEPDRRNLFARTPERAIDH